MKSQRFILIVLVVAILGISLWWFTRPTAEAPEKTAAPMPVKVEASKPIAPSQIAAPTTPPAPKPKEAPVAETTPDSADPQTDLKTAISDIVRMIRANDLVTFRKTYTPPDQLDPEFIQQLEERQQQISAAVQSPSLQKALQDIHDGAVRAWEDLENQTPVYNDAGDEATYQYTFPDPGGGPGTTAPRFFIKINGKWYFKRDEQ